MKLFIFFLIINATISLKPSDLCLNKEKECKGDYDKYNAYNIKCNQVKCNGLYKYSCLNGYCTIDMRSCLRLMNIHLIISVMNDLPSSKLQR